MKKLLRTLALTVATVLVFGLTVSAADSVSTNTASAVDQQLAVDAQKIANNGVNGATGKIGNLNEQWLIRAQRYADGHGLGKVQTIFFFDSSATNATLNIMYEGTKENQSYVFLHYTGKNAASGNWNDVTDAEYDANAWEVINVTVDSNKRMSGYFTKFSPIGIAEGTASTAAVVAPKTGEVIALAAIMALVMIAGAAVCAKKARLQK